MRISTLYLIGVLGMTIPAVVISEPSSHSAPPAQEQQQSENETEIDDFFDEGPDHLDDSAQLSSWQLYFAAVAQRLYIPQVIEYGAAAYDWISERIRTCWVCLYYTCANMTQDRRDEQQQ